MNPAQNPCINDLPYEHFEAQMANGAKRIHENDRREGNKPIGFANRVSSRYEAAMIQQLPVSLTKAECKPSPVHGTGAFSTMSIKKGELITLFPCDVLEKSSYRTRKQRGSCSIMSERMRAKFGASYEYLEHPGLCDYRFSIKDTPYHVIGHPDFHDNPTYIGHMINDSAKPMLARQSYEIYLRVSLARRNCEIRVASNISIAVVAVKDIEPGEELFMTYGLQYWLAKIMNS
jgi:hypothetical protein